jgi:hypothetical protein
MSALLLDDPRFDKPELQTYAGLSSQKASPLRSVPIFEIGAFDHAVKLRKPVVAKISFEGGIVFAENETLALFGSGADLAEAIAEFHSDLYSIWHHYHSLSDDQVTGHGRTLKAILDGLAV